METEKQKAEAYVRSQIPELMELSFGCVVNPDSEGIYHVYRELIGGYVEAVHVGYDEGSLVVSEKQRVFPKKIIGHPIKLNDWLRSIGDRYDKVVLSTNGFLLVQNEFGGFTRYMKFHLTTGQPATDSDWRALCDILGI